MGARSCQGVNERIVHRQIDLSSRAFSEDEYQASSGLARNGTAWVGFVTGHDLSRAAKRPKSNVGFSPCQMLERPHLPLAQAHAVRLTKLDIHLSEMV
jgi:hypothetical protein